MGPELRRWRAVRRGCWKGPGLGMPHPAGSRGGGNDSTEGGREHIPENSGMLGWLWVLEWIQIGV